MGSITVTAPAHCVRAGTARAGVRAWAGWRERGAVGGGQGVLTFGMRSMEDEMASVGSQLKRLARALQRRGHATYFHANSEFQPAMEMSTVADWAQVMNERRGWRIRNIRKNPDEYPDCLADFGSNEDKRPKIFGIEVTELVSREAIDAYQKMRRLSDKGQLDQLSDADRLSLLEWMEPSWSQDQFRDALQARIDEKGRKARAITPQFLLVVTDELGLDEATLTRYLEGHALARPSNFDAVYLMVSYRPNPPGQGYYPVFEVFEFAQR